MFPCTSHATCLNSSKKKREISGGKRQLPSPKSHPERDRSVEGRGWESHLGGGERFSRSPTSDWLVCKLCVKFNAWTWFGYVDDFEVLGQVDLIVCLFVCLFVLETIWNLEVHTSSRHVLFNVQHSFFFFREAPTRRCGWTVGSMVPWIWILGWETLRLQIGKNPGFEKWVTLR